MDERGPRGVPCLIEMDTVPARPRMRDLKVVRGDSEPTRIRRDNPDPTNRIQGIAVILGSEKNSW